MRTAAPMLLATALLVACSKPEPAPEPPRVVRTITVAPATASGEAAYAAEVRARVESQLGFRVAGKLMRRDVDLGSAVKAGQRLAQLDPQDLRLGQQSARAALAAAQTNFEQADADFKRFRELQAQGFISAADLERRESTLKAAQAQVSQLKAQGDVQANQATYAALTADAPGVVTAVLAEPGQVVAAGAPVVRVAEDGPRDAVFSVPERQVPRLRQALAAGTARAPATASPPGAGPFVEVQLWGATAWQPATLREVAAAADAATRTFLVKADIGRAEASLGQTATVRLRWPDAMVAARLPLSALREVQGRTEVWRVDPATLTVASRPVQVGGADGSEALVTSGLQAGDVVVTAGVHVLVPGQKVRLEKAVLPAGPGQLGAPTSPGAPAAPAVAASGG
jgi:multidrug efflux system membrane fusion protein